MFWKIAAFSGESQITNTDCALTDATPQIRASVIKTTRVDKRLVKEIIVFSLRPNSVVFTFAPEFRISNICCR